MALTAAKLTKGLPEGRHMHRDGLMLVVGKRTSAWTVRVVVKGSGKRVDYVVGYWPAMDLKAAEQAAEAAVALARQGVHPGEHKAAQQAEAQLVAWQAGLNGKSLTEIVDELQAGREKWSRTPSSIWRSSLKVHVEPALGARPITEFGAHKRGRHLIAEVLAPIWDTQRPTAQDALRKIRAALVHAEVLGLDVMPTEADAAGHILKARGAKVKPGQRKALPWQEVPDFWAAVATATNEREVAPMAIRLAILSAQRWGACKGALISEFDFEASVWTIPAERMKGTAEKAEAFRVPITPAMAALVRECQNSGLGQHGELFPSPYGRGAGPIGDAAGRVWLREHGWKDRCDVHGFRTCFRGWASARGVADELAERALAHQVGSAVTRAYDRDDRLEQRRPIMERWARFVTTGQDE